MSPTFPPPPCQPDEWQTVPLAHLEMTEREAIRLALQAAFQPIEDEVDPCAHS